ncbi:MAG: antiterminator LoaP [Lachnospiraceae bacterium]|nr:antiterminator LoaP [Lachnospiraceae bacterium]
MWYVVQVRAGAEEKICAQCAKKISETLLRQSFLAYYEERKKRGGKWETQKKVLFPGYVFLDTDEIEKVFFELKKVIGLTKILGIGEDIVPLTEEEVRFLTQLGGENHVVEMSEGIIEGARVKVQSGPLMGKEALIKKIDRHKRKAYLELELFGHMQRVEVGLEITMKVLSPDVK